MSLAHFRMLIQEFLNKDTDIVPEEAPLILLYSKYAMCMAKNVKDNKHTMHIASRTNFLRNGDKWNIHKIHWCEGVMQLADISTNNAGEHDLTSRIKYIIVRTYNWDRTLVQEGLQNIVYSMEKELCMTRLYWVEDSTQSVWNVCRTLEVVYSRRNDGVLNENSI